jgi:hypothetical protein
MQYSAQEVCEDVARMTHIQIFGLEEGRMGNDGRANDIFKRKIEHKAGYMEQKWTQHRAPHPQIGVVPP